jgi:hypothetical protein
MEVVNFTNRTSRAVWALDVEKRFSGRRAHRSFYFYVFSDPNCGRHSATTQHRKDAHRDAAFQVIDQL